MKGSKALLITLAMTAGLLALMIAVRGRYPYLAAEHWRRQLDTVPDQKAGILLGQVAELGEPGIPVLVEALGSERESVARAGKQALWKQLDRWQMLHAGASSSKLAVLADALAERVGQFGPTARSDAADLATRILLWPLDSRAVDRSRVIASCEKVFGATRVHRGVLVENGLAARQPQPLKKEAAEGADNVRRRPPGADDPVQSGPSVVDLSRLPGGGLPIRSFPLAVMPGEEAIAWMADVRTEQPRRLPHASAAQPLNPLRQPDRLLVVPREVRTMPGSQAPSGQQPRREPTPTPPLSRTGSGDASPWHRSGERAEMETVELMRRLRSGDEPTADRSRAELVRRGFTVEHLKLARRLFDPDPEVRKQLARSLPGLQSVNAVPWLLWLSRDANCEVRLVAVGLIATTGDPALLKRIEQMARQDPDPRIQRQAKRIAQQRSGKR